MGKSILMILEGEFLKDERVKKEAISLTRMGYNLTLLCFKVKGENDFEIWHKIQIYRKHLPPLVNKLRPLILDVPVYEIFWSSFIKKIIKKQRFDFIHLHDLPLIKLVREISSSYNVPLVVDLHENRPEIMKLYNYVNSFPGSILISTEKWKDYQKEQISRIERLILVTREAVDYYRENDLVNRNCKISIVPNYPSLEQLGKIKIDDSLVNKYKSFFGVIYMGDTSLRRGIMDLLVAARELRNSGEVKFIILGHSSEQKLLINFIKKEKLFNVELLGFVPFERALSYIAAAKIGVSPLKRNDHHDTTYAAKIFNYMYFGKPIIASDCLSQVNLITDSNVGLLFEAGNSVQLASRITYLKNNQLVYKEYSENARNLISDKCNWNRIEGDLRSIYD